MSNISSGKNVDNNYVDNEYENDYLNDDKYADIGSKIFDVTPSSSGRLTFFNLGIVFVDYIEMRRQADQITSIGNSSIADLGSLASAVSELAGLVGCSAPVSSNSSEYISKINDNIEYITEEMKSQVELYINQNDLTTEQVTKLNLLVEQVIEDYWLYYKDSDNKYHTIKYNDLLEKYKQEASLRSYSSEDVNYLLQNCKTSNKIVNLYNYVETNLQEEMKIAGVTTGKEYINLILEKAGEGATTNREKAVRKAVALNKFLGEHGIATRYDGNGGGHGTYSVDDISTGTDCSSYASSLARLGNSDFEAGYTYVLYNSDNTTDLDINNILPGDIIVSHGNKAYEHARYVIAIDKENNRIIAAECGGYKGSGGIDSENDGCSKTHVDSFDINTLIKQGYKTNHVDYGDGS